MDNRTEPDTPRESLMDKPMVKRVDWVDTYFFLSSVIWLGQLFVLLRELTLHLSKFNPSWLQFQATQHISAEHGQRLVVLIAFTTGKSI